MIILKKYSKNSRLVARPHFDGSNHWEVVNQGRRVFGRGWDEVILKDYLTKSQIAQIKKELAAAG